MLERRTMIGGGVIGPNDTEFMGYPIVNSIEGPLTKITSSDCTEGCITRFILYDGNISAGPCIIVYVLRLNDDLYLIDSHCQIVQVSGFNASRLLVPKLGSGPITTEYASFPNDV